MIGRDATSKGMSLKLTKGHESLQEAPKSGSPGGSYFLFDVMAVSGSLAVGCGL